MPILAQQTTLVYGRVLFETSKSANVTICDFFMPPTLNEWGTYWFRLVRMCVCVGGGGGVGDILVSACPHVCVWGGGGGAWRYRLETSCMDSSWKNSRRVFLVFPELSPLVKLRPFDKQGDEIL